MFQILIRAIFLCFSLAFISGCVTTEAEKDAQYSTPKIPLSDGTFFTQRVTPASTCRQKFAEVKRVNRILDQKDFVKRGRGELLVFMYHVNVFSDFIDKCLPKKRPSKVNRTKKN